MRRIERGVVKSSVYLLAGAAALIAALAAAPAAAAELVAAAIALVACALAAAAALFAAAIALAASALAWLAASAAFCSGLLPQAATDSAPRAAPTIRTLRSVSEVIDSLPPRANCASAEAATRNKIATFDQLSDERQRNYGADDG
jgi:hypothetical protein